MAPSWRTVMRPREGELDPPGLTRFGSCRVMLHEEATECQLNELGPF